MAKNFSVKSRRLFIGENLIANWYLNVKFCDNKVLLITKGQNKYIYHWSKCSKTMFIIFKIKMSAESTFVFGWLLSKCSNWMSRIHLKGLFIIYMFGLKYCDEIKFEINISMNSYKMVNLISCLGYVWIDDWYEEKHKRFRRFRAMNL